MDPIHGDTDRRDGDLAVDAPSSTTSVQLVTRELLAGVRDGSRAALDALFSHVYRELDELARRQRRRWQGDHTLDTSALVHDAYLKLVGQGRISVESRAHFFALAARAMRHILINYARDRRTRRAGGRQEPLPLEEASLMIADGGLSGAGAEALIDLHGALERLERVDPRGAKVVECRFFGGMTVDETADALGVSPRTVKRDWALAQAWLNRELEAADG